LSDIPPLLSLGVIVTLLVTVVALERRAPAVVLVALAGLLTAFAGILTAIVLIAPHVR
jgi:hypothetical protein